jgi:ribosome biogenesis protein NSA1
MVSSGNCGIRDKPILATCDSAGGIAVVDADALSVVARYEAFLLPSSSSGGGAVPPLPLPLPSSSRNDPRNAGTLTHTKGGRCNVDIATCLSMNASGTAFAVGGRERGARLLDVETGVVIWKAKNLPPDPLTLLQKLMWTTSISFLRSGGDGGGGGGAGGGETDDTMACGTACGQVQIYDVRSPSSVRRPSSYTPERMLEHRITALCQLMGGNVLAAGDAAGDVHLLDLRRLSTGRYLSARKSRSGEEAGLGRLAGPGGSVRQLSAHPNMPHVVSCVGLDRKLWTWDLNAKNGKKKPLDCVYLKQRLNCVLFCDDGNYGDDGTTNAGGGNAEEEEGEEGGLIDDDGRGGGAGAEGRERDLEDDAVEDYVDSDDDDDDNAGERSAEDDVVVSGSTEETEADDGEGSGSSDDDYDEDDDDEDNADDDAVVIASSKRRRT